MELSEKYSSKIAELQKALKGFSDAMKIDLFSFTEVISDIVKNGQIQKFQYCSELLWKTVKVFMYEKHGMMVPSPKNIYRELFKNSYIDEQEFEKLIKIVDDRNLLSHIYNENYFEEVYKRLPEHLELMKIVAEKITE
jgi:nucleotidyltransferase substrate binding protein (TIGR01987 family)